MIQGYFNWFVLLFYFLILANCNGQIETSSTIEKATKSKTTVIGASKLFKSQHSTESDNVNSGLEDKKGNLWFGTTAEGVYKFDGKTFVQYTKSDGLKSNMTYCIFESSEGEIWLGTDDGLFVFNGNAFSEVYITDPVNSLHDKFCVFNIMEDKNGTLWFATVEGVYTYDGESFELFTVSKEGKGYMSNKHNTEYMLQDTEGNIWFGSRVNDGVFRYDGTSIVNFELEELDGHKWAWPALQDKNGNIWFTNWGGAYRYDGQSFTSFTQDDGLCNKAITRIMEDKQGNIWFGGGNGICIYDGDSFTHITTKDGLPHNSVWSITEDSKQNIWIGTRNTGLCKYDGETIINLSESNDIHK
ncbi:MAG: hypothetical protein MRY78_07555 [Saprospiraceae bacterium]|nr:hypothetical protein [Saprospiraceae bacterium]